MRLLQTEYELFLQPSRLVMYQSGLQVAFKIFQQEYFSLMQTVQNNILGRSIAENGYAYYPSFIKPEDLNCLSSICSQSLSQYKISDRRNPASGCPILPSLISSTLKILSHYSELADLMSIKGFRLDGLRFLISLNVPSCGSRLWHRDSVGNRLKIFIVLGSYGSAPTTAIIPKSHTDSAHPKNIDILRTFPEFGPSKLFQDQIESTLVKYYASPVVKPSQQAGDIFILDTNAFHKAEIPVMNSGDCAYGKRMHLVLEYMPINASNFCTKYGPCAPGHPGDYPIRFPDSEQDFLGRFGFDYSCMNAAVDGIIHYSHPNHINHHI